MMTVKLLLLVTLSAGSGWAAIDPDFNILRNPDDPATPAGFGRCKDIYLKHQAYFSRSNTSTISNPYPAQHVILLWQAVVLLICFGAFALFVNLIQRIIRTYIYYDAHLLDTFFDAGGDNNVGMVACSIIARWTVAATFVHSSSSVRDHGVVGHFWFAAGAVVHLFLFAIVAAEIRIKAPGSKTFLQVIYARFGPTPHIILMIFALLCNLLVASAVTAQGVEVLQQLSPSLGKEVMAIIIGIVVALFTVVGGVGGYIYLSYFACAIFMAVTLVFFVEIYFDPFNNTDKSFGFGDMENIFRNVTCGRDTPEDSVALTSTTSVPLNEGRSLMTFLSTGGLVKGILMILSGFGGVFCNNGYFQSAIAAKPGHSVWGYLTAGLAAFSIPFAFSFAIGMGYWILSVNNPQNLMSSMHENKGFIPLVVANKIFGETGDFLIFTLIMTAVITTAASEVLSVSSIVIYDIYQTYLSPFHPSPLTEDKKMAPIRFQRAMYNDEYLEYDKRCVVLKHVVVVGAAICLIPLAIIVLAIPALEYMWLHYFTAIMVGSCTIPIALAVTWHRTTGTGVATGAIGGFICAFVAWLAFAATQDGGLQMFKQNTFKPGPLLVGTAVSLGLGGLLCITISLVCGGCDADLYEDEEWEKTREVDNPVLPWAVKYARDIGPTPMIRGRPHFYTVRRTYMGPEICAYIIGVLFAVILILVWPACMLTIQEFDMSTFKSWTILVLIWTSVAAGYIILVPIIWELIQTCKQAYYNRLWGHLERGLTPEGAVEPGGSDQPPSETPRGDSESDKDSRAALAPSSSPGNDTADRGQRWKTFIHLT